MSQILYSNILLSIAFLPVYAKAAESLRIYLDHADPGTFMLKQCLTRIGREFGEVEGSGPPAVPTYSGPFGFVQDGEGRSHTKEDVS